jgi:phosphopantothenoylcysteine decarboxylase / phosphopantothenate---cysteine ligase
MAEPEEIINYLEQFFSKQSSLKGLSALVTAGPTHESIDPVRYIGNRSTGTMGVALAEELAERGAYVYLVIGPSEADIPCNVEAIRVNSASQMYEASLKYLPNSDIIIMAAAVADYTPEKPAKEKIKKEHDQLSLSLIKTKDILSTAGKLKTKHQTLIGFALETTNERENALQKLTKKNADLIVLNSLNNEGAGFGKSTNKITIFDKKGNEYNFDRKPKQAVAKDIINTIISYRNV